MALPQVVTHDEWLVARKRLLEQEKDLTRRRDALNAERRSVFGERDDVVGRRRGQGIEEVGSHRGEEAKEPPAWRRRKQAAAKILADGRCRLRSTIPAPRRAPRFAAGVPEGLSP